MRVLGLSTDWHWGASPRILGAWLQALAADGDVVALACVPGSALARGARAEWPRLSIRDVQGASWWRRTSSVREVVQALKPDAVLVYDGDDAAAAALAMGSRAPVIWRMPMQHQPSAGSDGAARDGHSTRPRAASMGWRHRTALARGLVRRMEPGLHTVCWPPHGEGPHGVEQHGNAHYGNSPHGNSSRDNSSRVEDDRSEPGVLRLTPPVVASTDNMAVAAPRVTLVLPPTLDDDVVYALRVLGAMHRRHPLLQVRLVAQSAERASVPSLQDVRVHAAALGLATALSVQSLDTWLGPSVPRDDVVWVVDGGDAGALAMVDAMHRATPVLVMADGYQADLVLPGVTGLRVPRAGPASSPLDDGAQLLSDLARILGDAEWRQRMGAAGQRHLHRIRAPRAILHGMRVMLDPTSSPLA